MDRVKFSKKDIFRWRYALLFCMQFAVFTVVVYKLLGTGVSFEPKAFVSVQVTISLLSITIMQLLLSNGEETMLGLSFRNIFFKWEVMKYFNLINCLQYMMLLMSANLVLSMVSTGMEDEAAGSICRIGAGLALLETLPLACYMVRLGLLARYKKSRIYLLILKRIKRELSGPSAGCPICRSIVESKDYGPPYVIGDRTTSTHNQYVREEFFILAYLFLNTQALDWVNIDQEKVRDILYYKMRTLFEKEFAYNYLVFDELYAWGKKKFGAEIEMIFYYHPKRTCLEALGYNFQLKQ